MSRSTRRRPDGFAHALTVDAEIEHSYIDQARDSTSAPNSNGITGARKLYRYHIQYPAAAVVSITNRARWPGRLVTAILRGLTRDETNSIASE